MSWLPCVCLFVCFLRQRRTCSTSMLDVVCARTCLTQRWPLELSRHRNCSIFEHMFGFSSVCVVCGLIIEMVPQGDVSSTSQTLSFILVVSRALPLSAASLACLYLFYNWNLYIHMLKYLPGLEGVWIEQLGGGWLECLQIEQIVVKVNGKKNENWSMALRMWRIYTIYLVSYFILKTI